ncbi:MAG: hypothetical protein L6Q75_07920 [Burkholderiaceae bacterium]|nr:hypothetical protein [Burkholderiaceae bacterium]
MSIRSGRGSATHDRVLRFLPTFDCPGEAARCAGTWGLEWLGTRTTGTDPSPTPGN